MTSRVASRYVKSLLELAVEQKVLDIVHKDMQMFSAAIDAILQKILQGKVHQLTLSIIDILTRKNREPLLPEIAREFHNAYNEYKGIGKAKVTTPVALDAATRKKIEEMVRTLSNKKDIELDEIVDKDLIGGFILNVGDRQIDSSIRSKIKSLKVKFSENPYIKEF
jgi:F-type H+-transporting ATPase subunit delta